MTHSTFYTRSGKRALDIAVSVLALPVTAVVALLVAIAIKLEDRGPVFYAAPRLGQRMAHFPLFKFRSMKVDAPDIRNDDGSTFNSADDPRVTRVGRFIRRTSLDELPQLINVIRGEMSIVGPRPSPLGNEHRYSDEFRRRFEVRPGLTGYAQAYLRNLATAEQRTRLDVSYVDEISLRLDARIVLRTVRVVLTGHGVHRNRS
ncbi:sugar transferase [Microbacterium esteraromaticum]|uniref:Sugar transferase n=1 Tax=Microbacterium esteraromaticum TaxID=57043 RepID=A0A7D8ALG6_9MICO|nr:sugar transferase [Microbacterium esteraromaticum]QMU97427.1 sugar transferase [Microbacterium esteraromaticum]